MRDKKSSTGLWSVDPGEGRSINATLGPSEQHPNMFELDMRWSDGKSVTFPVVLTGADLQNIFDLVREAANSRGIEISLPTARGATHRQL